MIIACEPSLTQDELVAVRGLIQERYDFRAGIQTGAGAEPTSPAHGVRGDDSAPGVDSFPPSPPGARSDDAGPEWVGWAVPAICEVLANHHVSYRRGDALYGCYGLSGDLHGRFEDYCEWIDHVAPILAVHLQQAANPPAPFHFDGPESFFPQHTKPQK